MKFLGVNVKSNFFLAPMADVTNLPFRLLCKKYGCGMGFTEQINSTQIARNKEQFEKEEFHSIKTCKEEKPVCVQLFGNRAEDFGTAAKIIEKKFEILNINCGCPAPKETSIGAGAALLKEPKKIAEIIKEMKSIAKKPITAKIRLGWNKNEGIKIAKVIEKAGADAIIIHGRTAVQGYSGEADWKAIRKISENVSIPVVANGDVDSKESAEMILEKTKCEFAMIGREAMRNPLIFREITEGEKASEEEKVNLFFEYYELCKKYRVVEFTDLKIKAMQFTKGIEGTKKTRVEIVNAKKIEEIKSALKKL